MKYHKNSHHCRICNTKCGSLFYCKRHDKSESASDKKIIRNIPCPHCKHDEVVYLTSYRIKRTAVAQRRFKCLNCKVMFTERTADFGRERPMWIRQQIIRLYSKNKGFINKFDNKKKLTYSTRDIAAMLDVSKSFVQKVLQ